MSEHVLVLRTCRKNLASSHGFTWPKAGPVSCPDWDPKPECGNGLHGLLWGHGGISYLGDESGLKWLVVKVLAADIVVIGKDKVKFPRGEVVYCGTRDKAVAYLQKRAPKNIPVLFGKYPRRFTKLDSEFKALAKSAKDWTYVRDNVTGLEWTAKHSENWMPHADAVKYASGLGNDFRLPTVAELLTLFDGSKHPYVDRSFFKWSYWWFWSGEPVAGGPGYAWCVDFSDGGAYWNPRDFHFHVLAVRGPSQ